MAPGAIGQSGPVAPTVIQDTSLCMLSTWPVCVPGSMITMMTWIVLAVVISMLRLGPELIYALSRNVQVRAFSMSD